MFSFDCIEIINLQRIFFSIKKINICTFFENDVVIVKFFLAVLEAIERHF